MRFNLLAGFAASFVVLTAMTTSAFAGTSTVAPEVDPGSIGAAVALLVGGYLVVISRSRRK